MSAPLGPPPAGGDQDRGRSLRAMFWTECILVMIIIALRFHTRIVMRNLGADDWMMLFTVFLFLVLTCFITHLTSIGGVRHLYYLTPAQTLQAVKWSWITQPWGIFLFAPGKAAVAILVLRIMGKTSFWRRSVLYAVIACIFIVNGLGCIITFVQCDPPRALWTPSLPAHCWNPKVQEHFNFFMGAWNIFTDVVLALFPITIFWNLQLRLAKRIALCCLLGLGLVAALFNGIKIQYIVNLTARSDFTWEAYNIHAWTGAEAFIMIICGCIPPLKPVWDRFVTHKVDSSYGHTPINNNNMKNYHSKLSSIPKTSSSGESTNLVSGQWGDLAQKGEQMNEPRIRVVTEVDVVGSEDVV